jgi:hypothetical protein
VHTSRNNQREHQHGGGSLTGADRTTRNMSTFIRNDDDDLPPGGIRLLSHMRRPKGPLPRALARLPGGNRGAGALQAPGTQSPALPTYDGAGAGGTSRPLGMRMAEPAPRRAGHHHDHSKLDVAGTRVDGTGELD